MGKWVGNAKLGQDDKGAVDGGSKPEDMGVPKQRAPLTSDREVVGVNLSWLDRALGYVCWAIGPARSHLPNSVPAPHFSNKKNDCQRTRCLYSKNGFIFI